VPHRFEKRGHDRLSPCDFCCVVSHQFRDRGFDCLRPHDFCCAITMHGELWRVTVPPGAPNITTSRANRGSPRINRAAPPHQNLNVQDSERLHGKGCWPHPRVRSFSRGGPGGHYRYPEDWVPPRTSSKSRQKTGRGCVPTCPKARLSPPSSGQLRGHRVSPWLRLLPQGSSGATACCLGYSTRLLAQGCFRAATCPVSGLYKLQAIK
jgi:hypothetical protein